MKELLQNAAVPMLLVALVLALAVITDALKNWIEGLADRAGGHHRQNPAPPRRRRSRRRHQKT